jgi:hypothetical protein
VKNANGQKGTQQDGQVGRQNGGASGDADDSDMQDADVEEDMDDDDDDMMDKISSSPSIDDGGYFLPLCPASWPQRIESLTPESSPMPSAAASSSPFTTTPIHFPISVASARRPLDVPAPDTTPVSTFPYSSVTIHFSSQSSQKDDSQSTEHHHGEYAWTRTTPEPDEDSEAEMDVTMSPRSKMRKVVERRLRTVREDSLASVGSDLDEDQASSMLRPMRSPTTLSKPPDIEYDPFLEPAASPPRTTNSTPPPMAKYPDEEDDSWTTDSDADTWDEGLDKDDDASNDVSFSEDPRFIDSGWGGECLRETEDIDFEFVYALHTFVATVEGQANATKGDTMVLLDDSNSYWWLVRVVKDSSIGKYCNSVRDLYSLCIRIPPGRAHRDTYRTISAIEQAQKYRSVGNYARRYRGEVKEPFEEGHAEEKCEDGPICTTYICRSLRLRLLVRRGRG